METGTQQGIDGATEEQDTPASIPVAPDAGTAKRVAACRAELSRYLGSSAGRAESMRVARKFLASEEDALDALQDASLRVVQAAHQYDPTRRFEPWFLLILSRICLQYLRKAKSRGPLLSLDNVVENAGDGELSYRDALPDVAPATADQALSQAIGLEGFGLTTDRMSRALLLLPKLHRDVLFFRYARQWEREQVAHHLGQSMSSLGDLTSEALKLLKRYYEEIE